MLVFSHINNAQSYHWCFWQRLRNVSVARPDIYLPGNNIPISSYAKDNCVAQTRGTTPLEYSY